MELGQVMQQGSVVIELTVPELAAVWSVLRRDGEGALAEGVLGLGPSLEDEQLLALGGWAFSARVGRGADDQVSELVRALRTAQIATGFTRVHRDGSQAINRIVFSSDTGVCVFTVSPTGFVIQRGGAELGPAAISSAAAGVAQNDRMYVTVGDLEGLREGLAWTAGRGRRLIGSRWVDHDVVSAEEVGERLASVYRECVNR